MATVKYLGILFSFLIFFFHGSTSDGASSFKSGSVYCKNTKCSFRPNVLDWNSATAVGTFNDTLLSTGWGILDVSAGFEKNESKSNQDIMYAAGFLEGVFTARQMELHYPNLKNALLSGSSKTVIRKLKHWFIKQREWTDMMVSTHQHNNPLWRHMGYMTAQLDGLFAGYKSVRPAGSAILDQFAISFLNANGDVMDLLNVLDPRSLPDTDWTKVSEDEINRYINSRGHCSALVKLLPGYENIYMAHSSWFTYEATNRIYKHYNFNVDDSHTAAKRLSFSSYPGYLASLDDFYLLGSGMVMLQTSIAIFNMSLYEKVTTDSLLAWQRVRLANMMAHGGEEWTHIFKQFNSGTYNNEYLVIDLNKFKPQYPLVDGTLWVADQIPGLVVAADLTDNLREGYFPSYNIPFFEEIANKSGLTAMIKKMGVQISYDLAPRASIFRRDQSKVSDLKGMKKLMRYNDYKNDPYSGASPWGAICSRGDLYKSDPKADGCYDTKVSDFDMARALQADIINGPTLGAGFPPFSWTGRFAKMHHQGLPHEYNFDFIKAQPRFH